MDDSEQAADCDKEGSVHHHKANNKGAEQSTESQPDARLVKSERSKGDAWAESSEQNTFVETVKDDSGFIFYTCRFCGLTFNYMNTLRAHERVHNVDQPYKCNKCSESFHFMCELEYHAKQHSDQKGYKCECGRTFHTYTDLLYHKHPGEDDEVVAQVPVIAVRSGQRIPESEFPVPEFIEKGYEPKHPLKVYSDVRSKPYICQYCSKSYADSRGLSYHMFSHRGERAFTAGASRYLMGRSDYSYISPVI
uniref:Zinc finger protein unc-98 n=1 Tax=Parascaris univalens TaxID=6257 RepID=A0A915C8X7_PARUN